MSGRNKSKVKIHMSKPELPPFLQRIKEQVVENEAIDRKIQSERKRKDRPKREEDPEDNPTIVKLNDDDLSEEEYKRLKKEDDPETEAPLKQKPDLSSLMSKSGNKTKDSIRQKKLTYYSSSSDDDSD